MIRTSPTRARTVRTAVPKAERKEMLFLTAEQVDTLANATTPRYRTLVYLAACTGMRAGECAALRVKHLDLLRGRVRVAETVADVGGKPHFGPPKNGRPREIGLPALLVDMLAAYLADQPHDREDFVFPGTNGGPMRHANFYARHFKPAVRRVLPEHLHGLRFHDLRHTCASLLIANGEHPKAVQERLGHSSIAITMDRYGHLFPDQEEALVERLDETLQKTIGAAPAPDATVTRIR